jgi:hypothetical protein
VRAASPSMMGFGVLVILFGVALDFALGSLIPGRTGRCRLVLVPRRGASICFEGIALSSADQLLAILKKRASAHGERASGEAGIDPVGADRALDHPEQ